MGKVTGVEGAVAVAEYDFTVIAKVEADGPEATREALTQADLAAAREEAWLAHLRRGRPNVPLDELAVRVLPQYKPGAEPLCSGLVVEVTDGDGNTTRHEVTIEVVSSAAGRASQRMLAEGALKPDQVYYYEVIAEPRLGAAAPEDEEAPAIGTFTVRHAPLRYLSRPLRPLIEKAQAFGVEDGWPPVFITSEALEQAILFSRRGGALNPPVESGAIMLGTVISCPETGELGVVATEAVEFKYAEATNYALFCTGETWAHVQAVRQARQADPKTQTTQIVGTAHGHPFPPHYGQSDCRTCDKRPTCTLTSVFPSTDDLDFSRSILPRAPWGFAHIFGVDAREAEVNALFGFRNGKLMERNWYVIPDFEWTEPAGGGCPADKKP